MVDPKMGLTSNDPVPPGMCHTLQWKRWVIEMNGPSIEELCCIALQILFLADAAVQSLHGWCVGFIELDGDQILAMHSLHMESSRTYE